MSRLTVAIIVLFASIVTATRASEAYAGHPLEHAHLGHHSGARHRAKRRVNASIVASSHARHPYHDRILHLGGRPPATRRNFADPFGQRYVSTLRHHNPHHNRSHHTRSVSSSKLGRGELDSMITYELCANFVVTVCKVFSVDVAIGGIVELKTVTKEVKLNKESEVKETKSYIELGLTGYLQTEVSFGFKLLGLEVGIGTSVMGSLQGKFHIPDYIDEGFGYVKYAVKDLLNKRFRKKIKASVASSADKLEKLHGKIGKIRDKVFDDKDYDKSEAKDQIVPHLVNLCEIFIWGVRELGKRVGTGEKNQIDSLYKYEKEVDTIFDSVFLSNMDLVDHPKRDLFKRAKQTAGLNTCKSLKPCNTVGFTQETTPITDKMCVPDNIGLEKNPDITLAGRRALCYLMGSGAYLPPMVLKHNGGYRFEMIRDTIDVLFEKIYPPGYVNRKFEEGGKDELLTGFRVLRDPGFMAWVGEGGTDSSFQKSLDKLLAELHNDDGPLYTALKIVTSENSASILQLLDERHVNVADPSTVKEAKVPHCPVDQCQCGLQSVKRSVEGTLSILDTGLCDPFGFGIAFTLAQSTEASVAAQTEEDQTVCRIDWEGSDAQKTREMKIEVGSLSWGVEFAIGREYEKGEGEIGTPTKKYAALGLKFMLPTPIIDPNHVFTQGEQAYIVKSAAHYSRVIIKTLKEYLFDNIKKKLGVKSEPAAELDTAEATVKDPEDVRHPKEGSGKSLKVKLIDTLKERIADEAFKNEVVKAEEDMSGIKAAQGELDDKSILAHVNEAIVSPDDVKDPDTIIYADVFSSVFRRFFRSSGPAHHSIQLIASAIRQAVSKALGIESASLVGLQIQIECNDKKGCWGADNKEKATYLKKFNVEVDMVWHTVAGLTSPSIPVMAGLDISAGGMISKGTEVRLFEGEIDLSRDAVQEHPITTYRKAWLNDVKEGIEEWPAMKEDWTAKLGELEEPFPWPEDFDGQLGWENQKYMGLDYCVTNYLPQTEDGKVDRVKIDLMELEAKNAAVQKSKGCELNYKAFLIGLSGFLKAEPKKIDEEYTAKALLKEGYVQKDEEIDQISLKRQMSFSGGGLSGEYLSGE